MHTYQKLLLAAFEQHGWQLIEQRHSDLWWIAELWVLSSLRHNHGLQIFGTFIVDPQAERPGDIASVRSIAFTSEPLSEWQQADSAPAVLYPARREFPEEIEEAMLRIERLRGHAALR